MVLALTLHCRHHKLTMRRIVYLTAMVYMKTAAVKNYDVWWMNVQQQHQLTFKLTACNDASILLSQMQSAEGSDGHEIRLGTHSNTRSSFYLDKTGTGHAIEVDTPNILKCTEPGAYWISFGDGIISIGTGPQIGINAFLGYNYSTLNIRFLAFATDNGATGNWMVSQSGDSGEIFKFSKMVSTRTK